MKSVANTATKTKTELFCIAPECPNFADYGIVCGQHIQDGPLAHLNYAIERIRTLETELARFRSCAECGHDLPKYAAQEGMCFDCRCPGWIPWQIRSENTEAELSIAQQTIDGLAEARCPCCDGFYDDHVQGKTEYDTLKVELKQLKEASR